MQLVYTPETGAEQAWEIDLEDLDLEEWELIEQHSGKTYEDIVTSIANLGRLRFTLLRPLLFIYLRRSGPVNYRDVKPKHREIKLLPSLDEMLAIQAAAQADPNYPMRDQLLAELEDDIAAARARGESGKDEDSPTPTPSENRASRRAGRRTASSST